MSSTWEMQMSCRIRREILSQRYFDIPQRVLDFLILTDVKGRRFSCTGENRARQDKVQGLPLQTFHGGVRREGEGVGIWIILLMECLGLTVMCDGGCWNGGDCIAVNRVAKCICPSSWTGSKCQEGTFTLLYFKIPNAH